MRGAEKVAELQRRLDRELRREWAEALLEQPVRRHCLVAKDEMQHVRANLQVSSRGMRVHILSVSSVIVA